MRRRRYLTGALFLFAALIVLPLLAGASSSSHAGVHGAGILTGCISPTSIAAEAEPQSTQIASVLMHTERDRLARDRRARAHARQEARASGVTVDRVLEIALHPMFLMVLAIPLIRRMRAS